VKYYDPRALPDAGPVGSLRFPEGPAMVSRLNGKLFAAIWIYVRSEPVN
jgi:hypothetical protein